MEMNKDNFYKVLLKLTKTNKIEWTYKDFEKDTFTVYLQNLPMEATDVTDLASDEYKEELIELSIKEKEEVGKGYIYETKICAGVIRKTRKMETPTTTYKEYTIKDCVSYNDKYEDSIIRILYKTIISNINSKANKEYRDMMEMLALVEDAFIDNKLIPSDFCAADCGFLDDIEEYK